MSESMLHTMQTLLNQAPDEILIRHQQKWAVAQDPNTALLLFGAGRLGRWMADRLKAAGIPFEGFCDNNSKLWETEIDGAPVYSAQQALDRFGARALFVVTVYTKTPVKAQLDGMGARSISFPSFAWLYPQTLLPHGALDLPHNTSACPNDIMAATELWHDEFSKQEFMAQVCWRLSLNDDLLPNYLPAAETYFPMELFEFGPNETLVDCGAFDGDSLEAFLSRTQDKSPRLIPIEADPFNFAKLQDHVRAIPGLPQDTVRAVQGAVGSTRSKLRFDATGTAGSSVGQGSIEVDVYPLDELLRDETPTFIKMDIEGAEYDALLGATETIRRHEPVLAICLYHTYNHLWQIPLFLASLSANYRFFLRRYSDECWEQVCYAIPRQRLRG